ncbi:MFS transporter, partial [Spirillospora sp. NPDC049652]
MNTDAFDPALRRLIAVVLLGGIMGILDATMVSVAADRLAREFGSTLSAVGWVSTGYLLALTVTVPVTAW